MKNKTKTAKKLLALVLPLMMIVTALPMMSFTSAAAEDLSTLATAINNYETKIAQGGSTYWTGLTNAFVAYNNAKRYYDAVKYGGYSGSNAATYASALNTAVSNMGTETEFVDYCSTTVYANRSTGATVSGLSNLIYYGAESTTDFKYAYTDLGSPDALATDGMNFRYHLPNFVLGLDGTETAKAPFQLYYFRSSGSPYFQRITCLNDQFTMSEFKISTSTMHTGNSTLNQFGNWAYDSAASSRYFAGNVGQGTVGDYNSCWVNNSNYYINQASAYISTSNSSYNLTSSNNSTHTDFGIQVEKEPNNRNFQYYGSDNRNYHGYAYLVYMTDYNAYYQAWKSIIPKLSYAGSYNGYPYTNAYNAAYNLDLAAALSLAKTGFATSGDISSYVDDWADRIQNAANYLKTAQTNATGTVSTWYPNLESEILTSDEVFAAGKKCFTDDSWSSFVTAYEAAKAHMADLSPAGTANQYSTDNTAVGNLYNNLHLARNSLTLKAVTEEGHVWTETARTPATCEADGSVSYKCDVCAQTKTETLTALGHNYTGAVNNLGNGTHNWACTNGCGTYGTLTGGKDATVDCSMSYANTSDTQHTGTCSVCGYNVTENHTWSTTGTTTDATCDTDGKTVYPCTKCTATNEVAIPATGAHTWENTKTNVKTAATCGADAVYYKECSVCHKSSETLTGETWTDTGSATGTHTWNDGKVTKAATCTEDGVKTFTCTVCGETKTEAISATGHTWTDTETYLKTAATCGADEVYYQECSVCHASSEGNGDTTWTKTGTALTHNFILEEKVDKDGVSTLHPDSIYACLDNVYYLTCEYCHASSNNDEFTWVDDGSATAEHQWSDWTVTDEPTCTESGWQTHTCSVCGSEDIDEIPALGHNFTGAAVNNNNGTHSYQCVNTGCTEVGTGSGDSAVVGGTVACDIIWKLLMLRHRLSRTLLTLPPAHSSPISPQSTRLSTNTTTLTQRLLFRTKLQTVLTKSRTSSTTSRTTRTLPVPTSRTTSTRLLMK